MDSLDIGDNKQIEIDENIVEIESFNENNNSKNEDHIKEKNNLNNNISNCEEEINNNKNENKSIEDDKEITDINDKNIKNSNENNKMENNSNKSNEEKMENKQKTKDEIKNSINNISKSKEDKEDDEKAKSDLNEMNKKKENENIKKDENEYKNNYYSYKPSKYKSILGNYELSESDKKLLEKYNDNNLINKLYNDNIGYTKKLTYNYETLKAPKPTKHSINRKYNTFNKSSKNNLNYDYLKPSNNLYSDKEAEGTDQHDGVSPKTYLERNKLSINNIAKDIDLSYNDMNNKPSRNATYSIQSNYTYKDYLNNNDNNNNDYYYLNNMSYNVSKKFPNLLQNTTLEQYHVPRTQYSIKKSPSFEAKNYSPFDYVKYKIKNDYKTIEPILNDNNDINETKNTNVYKALRTTRSFVGNNKNNDNTRKLNLKYNTLDYDNNNDNNNININSKTFKNKNENNLDYKNNPNKNKNAFKYNYFRNKNNEIEPYHYNTYRTILEDNSKNNDDIIIKNNRTGAVKDEKDEIIISTSPTDFYYNTLHEDYISKTATIPKKNNSCCNRVYPMFSNNDCNSRNKNNLFSYSSIMAELIHKNKNKNNCYSKYQSLY